MSTIRNLFIVAALAALTACSSGSTATGVGLANIPGVWTFYLVPTKLQRTQIEVRARLVETDGVIGGTVAAIQTQFPECFQGGSVTGTINGNQLVLTFTDDDIVAVINLSGTVRGTRADGTWSISNGPPTTIVQTGNNPTTTTTVEPGVSSDVIECRDLRGDWYANKVRT